jgi:hypothetical protein
MPRAFVRAAAPKRAIRLFPLPKSVRDLRTYLVVAGPDEASFATTAFFASV